MPAARSRRLPLVAVLLAPAAHALEPGLPQRTHSIGGSLRLALLRGEPAQLEPDAGFGFGVWFRWFYGEGLALAVEADYDHFGSGNDPNDQLSRTTFLAMQQFARPLGKLLPWMGLGAGVGIGVFRTPDRTVRPMELTDDVPVLRACGGVEYEIQRRAVIGVGAGYDVVLLGDSVGVPGLGARHDVTVFDDTFAFAAVVDYFF
jgi:hypothetical protein